MSEDALITRRQLADAAREAGKRMRERAEDGD